MCKCIPISVITNTIGFCYLCALCHIFYVFDLFVEFQAVWGAWYWEITLPTFCIFLEVEVMWSVSTGAFPNSSQETGVRLLLHGINLLWDSFLLVSLLLPALHQWSESVAFVVEVFSLSVSIFLSRNSLIKRVHFQIWTDSFYFSFLFFLLAPFHLPTGLSLIYLSF